MQKARRHPKGLRPLVSVWFQVLFHSPVRGTFHLSLTVLVHYRSLLSIQPYRMVPADSDRISRVPPYSGYYQLINLFQIQGYHLLWLFFPKHSFINLKYILQSYNPKITEITLVWANPISFATTLGITIVFSSSGYLDVSVHQVCLLKKDNYSSNNWVAPFGNFRLKGYLHLIETYRSLSRPSSPMRAQASAIRP